MPTVSFSELKSRTYDKLDNNTAFYASDEVGDIVNEAVQVFNLFTAFLQGPINTSQLTTPNRLLYDVPSPVILPARVRFNGRFLEPYGFEAMSRGYPGWMKETTANTGEVVAHWVPIGISKFAIHPADSTGNGQLEISGILEPDDMAFDDDKLVMPNEIREGIVDYAAHVLQLDEGGSIFAQSSRSYQSFMRTIKSAMYLKQMVMPSYFVSEAVPK